MTSPAVSRARSGPPPPLTEVLANRRWWRDDRPFPHFRAQGVFTPAFYDALVEHRRRVERRGRSETADPSRLSRNMLNSDAYAWDFPPDLGGPLSIFVSRAWHDMIAAMTDVPATGDVNCALHHHHAGSRDGFVHGDLGVAWFSRQPRADGINPMDLARCSYTDGSGPEHASAVDRVRAVTAIFYLDNEGWQPGDGGETALYLRQSDPVRRPAVAVAPVDNSILVFENTPHSYHAFLRNPTRARNSVILWLHRANSDVMTRWGVEVAKSWGQVPLDGGIDP